MTCVKNLIADLFDQRAGCGISLFTTPNLHQIFKANNIFGCLRRSRRLHRSQEMCGAQRGICAGLLINFFGK